MNQIRTRNHWQIRLGAILLVATLVVSLFGGIPMLSTIQVSATNPLSAYQTEGVKPLLPYMDKENYTFEERAADLVSRLTLDEKISQMNYISPKIDRLATDGVYINSYVWASEGLHGVCDWFGATSFPTSLSISSTWDVDLMERIASAISDEARAAYYVHNKGLTYWSPTVNLARDPRWGRNEETYGEDPYLTSLIGGAFVRGLQGDDDTYLKTVSTLKHFMANNSEFNRHTGNSVIADQEMYNYYALPYRNIIRNANVYSVMTAYNRVNGIPMSAHTELVTDKLRKTWGLSGYVVSDCGAITDIWKNHNWSKFGTPSEVDATAASVLAGTDLDCGSGEYNSIKQAIALGYMTEKDVDKAVYRLMLARMQLGEFDELNNYKGYGSWDDIRNNGDFETPYYMTNAQANAELEAADHGEIALEAAQKGITLLKNDGILPLKLSNTNSIAVVGDYAKDVILGDYSGTPGEEHKINALQGLSSVIAEQNASTVVSHYATAKEDSRPYLFNFKKLELLDSNGNVLRTLDTTNDAGCGGGAVEEAGGNFGYIADGSWVKYASVNLEGVAKVRAYVSISNDSGKGGTIDMHLVSSSGNMPAQVITPTSGTGWANYMPVEADYDSNVGYMTTADVYLNFKAFKVNGGIDTSALNEIANKDVAVVYVGMDTDTIKEDHDRSNLELPNGQVELINTVAAKNANTVVFIQGNGCVDISAFKNNVRAILYTPHNGQAQGQAFADVLTGKVNPGGKLTFTWLNDESELGPIEDYNMLPDGGQSGRTYMYYTGDYEYPFGYGLSYTTFSVTDVAIDKTSVDVNGNVTVTAKVTNSGSVSGSEVVQLYVKALDNTSASNPIKRLVGFQKVTLSAGQSQTISISVDLKDIALWDDAANKYDVKAGRYQFDLATTADDADVVASQTVSVSGSWKEIIQTATLESDTLVVGANENAKLSLSVSLDNDRMLNSGYTVTYTSSNPDVVKVSNDGTVTCSETAGVATVIATISYNGETVTASTPIVSDYSAALVRLTPKEVTLDGETFTIFDVTRNRYDVYVIGEKAPKLRVVAATGTTASVTQNGFALPSTATVVLTDELTGHQETYTVHFYSESVMLKPDDFTSQSLNTDLWKGQTIGSSSCEYIQGTGLRFHTNQGENSNMVLQRADGSFFVESKVHFSSVPSQGYQQGGLEVYQDASNFIKYTLEPHGDQSVNFKLQKIVGGTAYEISSSIKPRTEVSNTVYFRLKKEGSLYQAYYSLDGTNYIFVGAGSADFKNTSLALVGFHVLSAPSIDVTFNYVKLVEEQYVIESNGDSGIDYPTAPTVYLDGQRFYPFNAAQFEYDIAVKGEKAPTVTVEAADGTTAQVVQTSNDLPGTATIQVAEPSLGLSMSYTLQFGFYDRYIKADDFTSETLSDFWSVVNQSGDAPYAYQSGKGLTVKTTQTDYGNLILQPAEGTYSAESKIRFSALPSQNYQQGGLVVYQDNQNYVKLSLEPNGNQVMVKFQKIVNGTATSLAADIFEKSLITDNTLYFKMDKDGDNYSAFYSLDGKSFKNIGSVTVPMKNTYFGFVAIHVVQADPIDVTFEYLKTVADYDVYEPSEPQPTYVFGDLDDNGIANATDALMVLKIVVGKLIPDERQSIVADVNHDGSIGANDALKILQYVVGKVPTLD